ncbi:MAG: aryl-sulfate sulfotransferase [Ignavibacteria bacterium]|nr:aryl-sulfate sulfotransferase [Ignavibacteria bacterium]
MKKPFLCIFILILFFPLFLLANDIPVLYLSPLPDSKYNNRETNIIIRPYISPRINVLSKNGNITVTGSLSGIHSGKALITSEGSTIIFKPDKPFDLSETVTVKLSSRITGKSVDYEYKFFIKEKELIPSPSNYFLKELGMKYYSNSLFPGSNIFSDSLPSNFPSPTVMVSNNPSPGKIFITCFSFFPAYGTYLMIFNNDGTPHFYRESLFPTDFKKISNGNLVYFEGGNKGKYYELDTNYFIVDSFYTGNGYTTDQHELEYLENGNAYLMAYDPVYVNMDTVVPGGNTNALVTGLIIQEIDINKNVIFQWRSWDHIPITDCSNQDLYSDTIDYIHGNAIEYDTDGNIMISSRHLDEITKINRTTGAIIWRLGGKNNQFTFINDTNGFNYQHDIRRLKNGNITLYDNGNAHNPPFSRAVEYQLNEQSKTATLVWQYRRNPDVFGPFMGNVQRLDNGNTIIGWGGTISEPVLTVSEVASDGTVLFEMKLPDFVFDYRAYKFEWDFVEKPTPPPATYALYQNYPNPFNPETTIEFDVPEPQYITLKIYNILGAEIATLVNQFLQPQKVKIKWDASAFASGVYFYQITSNKFKETKKMVFVR